MDTRKGLETAFEAANSLCAFLALRGGTYLDVTKLAAAVSKQVAFTVTTKHFAIFKYLLPDEVLLEYQSNGSLVKEEDGHESRETDNGGDVLVFDFVAKSQAKSNLKKTITLIERRRNRFKAALDRFLSRSSIKELPALAAKFEPEQVPALYADNPNSLEDLAEKIAQDYHGQIRVVEATSSKFSEQSDLPDRIKKLLLSKNIKNLYTHQARGIEYITQGYNVVISTATASGKSLIFQIPVVEAIESQDATAMFIYPTKALSQDQRQSFPETEKDIIMGTFDGDTKYEERDKLRKFASIIYCNPDILHCTLLPQWSSWQRFLEKLRFVVIDELHYYQGLFGAHVAMVIRRLRRICYCVGNDSLQFICCSATIQRPIEFMSELTGLKQASIRLIDNDGSPTGKRYYVCLKTPQLVPGDPASGRLNPIYIGAPLLVQLISKGHRTIAFCPFRKECELLMKAVRTQAEIHGMGEILDLIMTYRGGYSAQDRRQIEKRMFNNELGGIVATSALELGIDVGSLDVVMIVGFPFSLSSFRQQVGRVGRRSKGSLVVYISGNSPLDMHYSNKPDALFTDEDPLIPLPLETSTIESHLKCAACELCIPEDEGSFFPYWHVCKKSLEFTNDAYHCPVSWLPNASKHVDIRSVEREETAVIDITNNRNVVLETLEFSRVISTVYEGAVYLHQGKPYIVQELAPNFAYAKVHRTNVTWTTQQRDFTDIEPVGSSKSTNFNEQDESINCSTGPVLVTTTVYGYFRMSPHNRILESVDIELPPLSAKRKGLWINIPRFILDTLSKKQLNAPGAIHGAEHLMLGLIPKFVAADCRDFATECKAPEKEIYERKQTLRVRPARLILYERRGPASGNGVLQKISGVIESMLRSSLEIVSACSCEYGCGECIASTFCVEKNLVISKLGTQVILRQLLSLPIEDIPDGPEVNLPQVNTTTIASVVL